jgi:hypothetical protein
MPYKLIRADQAPKAPDMPDVRGYLYNHGGLNNQKMALVALLLSGIRDRQPINLPYIYNRDQRTSEEYLARIEDIFDIGQIFDFAQRHDLMVLSQCPSGERGGWDHFRSFGELITGASDRQALETALDAVLSLKPKIVLEPALQQLATFIRMTLGIGTVLQLRIETDWQKHSANLRQQFGDAEDYELGFMQILTKVKNTFPDLRQVYVTADEQSMPAPKEAIRTACRDRFGLVLLWKSDLLPAEQIELLTPLDLSLIDFEIAKASPRFIGLTTSTFSNLLCLEKFAAARQPVRGHYIYNCRGDTVRERQDNGCCGGGAQAALSPTRVDALLNVGEAS